MSSLVNFEVTYDNLSRQYHPGSIVSGNVIMDLRREKCTEGIFLQIYGEGNVCWSSEAQHGMPLWRHRSHSRQRSTYYRSRELYADREVCLYKPDGGGSGQIPPGHYVYPFRFQMPFEIPASFRGHHGDIRYFLRARIVRKWKSDHKIEEFFTVVPFVDLNADVTNTRPIFNEKEEHFSAWCGFKKTGSSRIQIRLPKTGYVSGERIRPIITVDNRESRDRRVYCLKLTFLQRFDYKAYTGQIKSIERVLEEQSMLTVVDGGKYKELTDQELLIPAVVATNLGCSANDRCINVHYNVKLTCRFGEFSSKTCILSYVRI